jgi:probable rRNA maturation factor
MANSLFNETVKLACGNSVGFFANLLLTDDSAIRTLNLGFRGVNNSTNALSFPQYESKYFRNLLEGDKVMKRMEDVMIGDVAMSFDAVVDESIRFGKPFWDRCSHLFVHSALHLLGMDHTEDCETQAMESLESKILGLFEIYDPYVLGVDEETL